MNKKRIIITSLVGSIGLSVLSLSLSFAWYNSSQNLYLDTLVINVSSSRDLYIATRPDEDVLTTSLKYDLGDVPSVYTLDNRNPFKPVSTMFKSNWIDQKKQDPVFYEYNNAMVDEVNGQFEPVATEVDPTWGYYSQHLYLYCDRDTKVTIDSTTFNVNPIRLSNEEHARQLLNSVYYRNLYEQEHPDYTDEQIIEDLVNKMNGLVNCMRMGILDPALDTYKFTIVDPLKNGETELGGREDLFLSGYYDSYKNPYDDEWYEIIYGEVNNRGNAKYDSARDTDIRVVGESTSFNSSTKEKVHAFNREASLANGMEIVKEDSLSLDEVESKFYVSLAAGEFKEIVLTIYMEGWDKDCINSHMGGSFGMDLQFKVAEMNDQNK